MTNMQFCIARANKQLADVGEKVYFQIPSPPAAAPIATVAKPTGPTRAQCEAWLRRADQRKEARRLQEFEETRPAIANETARLAEIERQREAQLLAEAESEIRRRRATEGVK